MKSSPVQFTKMSEFGRKTFLERKVLHSSTTNFISNVSTLSQDHLSTAAGTLRRIIGWKKKSKDFKKPDSFLEKMAMCSETKTQQQKKNIFHTISNALTVIDTTAAIHYKWLFVVTLAVMYNIVMIIGRSIFWELQNYSPALWFAMDYACDVIYLLDMYIKMHEGYLEQGILVADTSKLRKRYVMSIEFRFDIVSVLPTDLLYFATGTTCAGNLPCPYFLRLNRLLRVRRMNEFFEKTETRTNFPNVFRISKVVLFILIIIHWNACIYFAISYYLGFGTDNWVYKNISDGSSGTFSHQYIYSFYWSTLTLTTIGETPQPERDEEYVFVTLDFLVGVLIFATIVGNVGSMITNMNAARAEFQNKMDGVKQYMEFRKVSKDLEGRIIKWFDYLWNNKQSMDEDQVLNYLPDKLKAEIAIHVHLETLKQVRIFQDCEPGLLIELVLKLKLQVFSPGDFVCRKGDVGKEMYIVKRGLLSVVGEDFKTVFATLDAGSVFGEVSILDIPGNKTGNRRTANVKSVGYSDLFCLSKDDLWESLKEYPEGQKTLLEKGKQILLKDNLIDQEKLVENDIKENVAEKLAEIDNILKIVSSRLSKLFAEFSSFQQKSQKRLASLEQQIIS